MSNSQQYIIPIDGGNATGKSFLGMEFAKRIGFTFMDSGLVYRVATLAVLEELVNIHDGKICAKLLDGIDMVFEIQEKDKTLTQHVRVGGLDITRLLHEPRIHEHVSTVAAHPEVREAAKRVYRRIIANKPTVMAGRDIGTVIFPDARLKFFITADFDLRAQRRMKQLGITEEEQYEKIKRTIITRDEADSQRKTAPLQKATDALEITNNGTPEEALAEMIKQYQLRIGN